MNKKNKKGFTLIELLAVIVVLAIIMILAVPNIITAMNKAKKKSFQMYGQRMTNSALSTWESDSLLSIGSSVATEHHYSGQLGSETVSDYPCYTLKDLGYTSTGSYNGFVVVEESNTANGTQYYVFLTDNTYLYNGVVSSEVENDITKVANVPKGQATTYKTTMTTSCK